MKESERETEKRERENGEHMKVNKNVHRIQYENDEK